MSAPFEGEVGEPNTFGGYLLFILCIVVGILLQNVPKKLRLTMICLSILIFIPFLFTLSRASYLGIVLSFIALIILSKRKIVLAGVAATIILAGMVLQPEAVFSRVTYTFQKKREARVKVGGVYLDPSASARIYSWEDIFEAWKKNPILGRGITGFKFLDGQYIRTFPEMGVVGFLALAWLLWIIFKHSLGIYKKMDDELYRGLALGFIAGFIGLVIHAMTANTFIIIRIMEPFWFIIGIVIMLPSLVEEERNEALKAEQTG